MDTPDQYTGMLLAFFIFFARIIDVSLGTVRIILVSKGYKNQATIISFIEIFIWIIVISRIIQHIDQWINYFAYAGGFAVGNYVGMLIEERMTLGYELISQHNPQALYTIEDIRYVSRPIFYRDKVRKKHRPLFVKK